MVGKGCWQGWLSGGGRDECLAEVFGRDGGHGVVGSEWLAGVGCKEWLVAYQWSGGLEGAGRQGVVLRNGRQRWFAGVVGRDS